VTFAIKSNKSRHNYQISYSINYIFYTYSEALVISGPQMKFYRKICRNTVNKPF